VSAEIPKATEPAAAKSASAEADAIPKPPRWLTTLRAEPPAVIGKLLGLACVLLILLIWYAYTAGGEAHERAVSPLVLPSPGEVVDAYGHVEDRGLYDSIAATMIRVLKGFGWAAVVGVALGIVAGSFRAVAAFLSPLVLFGRSLPLAALLPLTIAWFGMGEQQKEMFLFIAAMPFVFSDTLKAMSLVPERYVETAQTLGASRWQIIYKVLVPLALPDIITGLRFLFGLALGYIMLAEAINAGSGLGYMINIGRLRTYTADNYLLLIIIGILAYFVDYLLRFFQRYAFHYRKDL
jgi:ABC-type nitrate/sulfonate/bicarbonate transport system permease component